MRKGICLLIVLAGMFVLIGTAGAIDQNGISAAQFIIRLCVIIPIMFGAVYAGRLYELED